MPSPAIFFYLLLIYQRFHHLYKVHFDVELAAQPICSPICMIVNTFLIYLFLPLRSVYAWCANWKSYQIKDFKRSFCCLIPLVQCTYIVCICGTPNRVIPYEFESKKSPLPLEFQDAYNWNSSFGRVHWRWWASLISELQFFLFPNVPLWQPWHCFRFYQVYFCIFFARPIWLLQTTLISGVQSVASCPSHSVFNSNIPDKSSSKWVRKH